MKQETKTYRKFEDELWEAYASGANSVLARSFKDEERDSIHDDFMEWLGDHYA